MPRRKEPDPTSALEEQLGQHGLASRSESAGASARLMGSFRKMSKTERRYQLRRLVVIALGFSIPLTLTAGAYWLKEIFFSEPVSVEREFAGSFPLRAQISSEFNRFPGGPPRLRVSSQPSGTKIWTTVFEVKALDPAKLGEVYAEFVTPQVAFALFDTLFAVTTDGGYSWQTSVIHDTETGAAVVIDGAILDEKGSGFLFPPAVKSFDSCWTTENFGLSWEAP